MFELPLRICPADIDETPLDKEEAGAYTIRLAAGKAQKRDSSLTENAIIIAADTTVAYQGYILGKPESRQEAIEMLTTLRNKSHQVFTGIAVLFPGDSDPVTELVKTDVPMRDYNDDEMLAYIDSGEPFDKAGAYGIQHQGFHPVDIMEGCFANVMGFPLCHLARILIKNQIQFSADIAASCQEYNQYQCPVFAAILQGEL